MSARTDDQSDQALLGTLVGSRVEIDCDPERGGAVGRVGIYGAEAVRQALWTWSEEDGPMFFPEEVGRPQLASAHSLYEPLADLGLGADPDVSRLHVHSDVFGATLLVSFADLRCGVTMSDLTSEYQAYARALYANGVNDTRVWRECFDAGLPVEYATELYGAAA